MDRFARGFAYGLLLIATGLAGCGGSGSGLLTGATAAASDAPGAPKPEDPLMRPFAVALTSARAQRCGFNFDPAKLRASYLAYEARQSPSDLLPKAEKVYDATFKAIRASAGADPEFCTDSKSAAIKKDLVRHLAGDFKSDIPAPKKVETCGGIFELPCSDTSSSQPFDAKKFWEDQATKNTR